MQRSKKIVLIANCVLNQNSVVSPLARAKGAYREIMDLLMENEVGIIQLPCPETMALGLGRDPMDKSDYLQLDKYVEVCRKSSEHTIETITPYIDSGYEVVGVIGINQSPSCSIFDERGVFMEYLIPLLEEKVKNIRCVDISTSYNEDDNNDEDLVRIKKVLFSQ